LRNPLAAPSLFGAPAAAAFGAVAVISLGLVDALSYALPLAALTGALISVGLLLLVAGPRASLLVLILAGLAISSLAGAGTSLALLALLVPVPFLGISPATAIVALFLYSLLPIVRNTATGLQDIPPDLRDSAEALGLSRSARLTRVDLPLASRSILAGIKTSAVIAVGTATLAALIGAGGLGEPIVSGLNLNDHATILEGAVPAALLALLVQGAFELADRAFIPRGLRLPRG
jgi:osmoprotectant transport system permease protein